MNGGGRCESCVIIFHQRYRQTDKQLSAAAIAQLALTIGALRSIKVNGLELTLCISVLLM